MNTNLATVSKASTNADFIQSTPRTDGPAWKAAEAEGHDMTIVASLLTMSLEERIKTHASALATVNMLRGAKLEHG
ncbi:MAG: hypothetical protein NTV08_08075 [Verrucomicrobia bacterium]|nr:hypothetical protein [Verrucomicrobiota bacterium]